jgi:hypothetical protein
MFRRLFRRLWFVQDTGDMLVTLQPLMIMQILALAARPSTQRLHLRDVFVGGRRYELTSSKSGFTLTTTARVWWHYQRRTQSAAVLRATFVDVSPDVTRITLRATVRPMNLLQTFLLPLFVTSIILFVPWNPLVIIAVAVAMVMLAWLDYTFTAALEANEMLYFVHKALSDFAAEVLPLASHRIDVDGLTQDFETEWERFIRTHSESPVPDDLSGKTGESQSF